MTSACRYSCGGLWVALWSKIWSFQSINSMDIKLILTQFGVVGLYALFQNGRHVSILLFSCKLALVASFFNSKFKRTFSLTHWAAVTGPCLSSTSDIIIFDQNWHHLYWTSARGKDLSSDADQSDWPNGAWKSWVKNSEQNFLPLHLATPW